MCSVAEGDFGDEGGAHTMIKDIDIKEIEEENCKKCSVEKCVIKLDFKEAMCLSCFLNYVRHKFRATLGASKILKRNSNVLLEFKGTPADVCLLSMIKYAFEEEAYKRLTFDLKIVFVDENCTTVGDVLDSRMLKINEIKDVLQQFPGFKCSYSSIANSTKFIDDLSTISSTEDIFEIIESEKEFLSTYHSIDSFTSKEDFVEIMKKNAIRDHAHRLGCSYIFISDISVDIAKRLINNIALGRGSSVGYDVSFCDDRIDKIKIIRPLKDLNQKEVENYIKFNNLSVFSLPAFDNLASIQNLTCNFINELQKNGYNSTVSTVYRCSSKISPSNKKITTQNNSIDLNLTSTYIMDMNQRCLLCKSTLDYQHSETLYAIEFSRAISSEISSNIDDEENLNKIREISEKAINGNDRSKFLCHGCRNIVAEIKEEEAFLKCVM